MSCEDLFEAISHPLRIELLKALAEKPMRFADLKRQFDIKSSGLLDFHLKKLDALVTVKNGCYTLTEQGFVALQAVETMSKYGWQRRAFYVNLAACILIIAYTLIANVHWLPIVLLLTALWMAFYSYWTFVKRRVRIRNKFA